MMDVITLAYQENRNAAVRVAHTGLLGAGSYLAIAVALGGVVALVSSSAVARVILAATIAAPLAVALVKRRYAWYTSVLVLVSLWPSIPDLAIPTPLGKLPPIIPAVVLLLGLAVFRSMAVHRRAVVTLQKSTIPVIGIGILFFSWYLIVGYLLSPTLSTAKIVAYVGTGSIGVLLLAASDSFVGRQPFRWEEVLAIVASLVSSLGIAEFFTGWNPFLSFFGRPTWKEGYLWRAVSTMGNPLVLATYLLLVIPILYRLSRRRWVGMPALVLTVAAMLLTFSRSAYVALIVVLMVAVGFPLALSRRTPRFALTTVLILIAAFALSVWGVTRLKIVDEVAERLLMRDYSVSSLAHRKAAWMAIGEMMFKHPFGVGPANLNAVLTARPDLSSSFGMMIGTYDNAFLDIIGEVGLIGAVLYSAFIVSPALALLRRRADKQVILDSIAVTTGYIIMSFSFTTYFWPPVWVTYWWIQAALLNGSVRRG